MTILFFLAAATASQPGAQATAKASARVLQGERIELGAAAEQPGRQVTETVKRLGAVPEPVKLRLVEFN